MIEVSKYLKDHLLATSESGDFKEYDTIRSAIIGSFQDDIRGCCYQNIWLRKGKTSKELQGTKDHIELPLFGLLPNNSKIII